MTRELTGTHIVVVGATGVLGARLAAHLTTVGARVSAIVRDHTRLDGATVFQYALADITNHATLRTAFESVAPFDGVINATGLVAFGAIADLDDATLNQLFAVNAIAPIVMLRESSTHINDGGFLSTSLVLLPHNLSLAWLHTAPQKRLLGQRCWLLGVNCVVVELT